VQASHPEASQHSRSEDDAPWMGGLLCGVTSSSKGQVWSGLQMYDHIPHNTVDILWLEIDKATGSFPQERKEI